MTDEWSVPVGWVEGAPMPQHRFPGRHGFSWAWAVCSCSPTPAPPCRHDLVTLPSWEGPNSNPTAAPEATSDVPFYRPWKYWVLGLCFVSGKQTESKAAVCCGLEPTCGAIAPTGPCFASFCTGDDHTSASCPTPPGPKGGHSWTHTSRAP